MEKLNVFYLIEVINDVECEPKIGFLDKKEAEKFLNAKGYSLFDGHNGWKIEKEVESQSIQIYSSFKEYIKIKSYLRAKRLRKVLAEEKTMDEME